VCTDYLRSCACCALICSGVNPSIPSFACNAKPSISVFVSEVIRGEGFHNINSTNIGLYSSCATIKKKECPKDKSSLKSCQSLFCLCFSFYKFQLYHQRILRTSR